MRLLIAALSAILAASAAEPASDGKIPVLDLHVDLPYQTVYKHHEFATGSGQYVSSELLPGGARGVVLPLFVPNSAEPAGRTREEFERSYRRIFEELAHSKVLRLPGCWEPERTPEQVVTWFAFEDSGPVAANEAEIAAWIARGVRIFGLVHTEHNRYGTSSGEPSRGRGLTELGRAFVELVWKLGGIVDVSHASDETTEAILDLAEAQGARGLVIATHSNARALADHPRNLKDDHLRRLGALGGVVGVNFHGRFLRPKDGRGRLSDVVEQVRYISRVAGPGAVAIGSDFEGGIRPPVELRGASAYPELARALNAKGVSRAQVQAAFFDNAWRVLCGKPSP